jgi:hypothetical protein
VAGKIKFGRNFAKFIRNFVSSRNEKIYFWEFLVVPAPFSLYATHSCASCPCTSPVPVMTAPFVFSTLMYAPLLFSCVDIFCLFILIAHTSLCTVSAPSLHPPPALSWPQFCSFDAESSQYMLESCRLQYCGPYHFTHFCLFSCPVKEDTQSSVWCRSVQNTRGKSQI